MSKTMLTAAIFGLAAAAAQASDLKRLDQLCKEVGKAEIAKEAASGLERDLRFWTTEGAVVHFSYSPAIDTCVGTRLDYLRNEWNVQDATEGFMDDHLILHCTKSGAFNVLIDRVKGFGGIAGRRWGTALSATSLTPPSGAVAVSSISKACRALRSAKPIASMMPGRPWDSVSSTASVTPPSGPAATSLLSVAPVPMPPALTTPDR